MFVLPGVNRHHTLEPTTHSLVSFLKQQLAAEETLLDFYERRLKDVHQLIVVGFESLDPVRLILKDRHPLLEMSVTEKRHDDLLLPILLSRNITNNQYIRILRDGKDTQNNNSFVDYYISAKVRDSKSPNTTELSLLPAIAACPLKSSILEEFYRIFNEQAYATIGEKKVGMEFFIDFNSLFDIQGITEEEITTFLRKLLEEYGRPVHFDTTEIVSTHRLNETIYLMENLQHQAAKLYELPNDLSMEDLFRLPIELPFEIPTTEKKMLRHDRIPAIPSAEDLPNLTFFEAVVLRFLTLCLNKQGKTITSGYRFPLEDGESTPSTLERSLQVTGDAYGNLSINDFEQVNVHATEAFKQSIQRSYETWFQKELPEEQSLRLFFAKFYFLMDHFSSSDKERKRLIDKLHKRQYRGVGKDLSDRLFRNIGTRLVAKDKDKSSVLQLQTLVDILFVVTCLRDTKKNQLEKVMFVTNHVRANDLSKQEHLSSEEFHFLLGATAGIAIRNSRNFNSLRKSVLKLKRRKEILRAINKRMESGVDEVDYLPMVRNWMTVLTRHPLFQTDDALELTSTEKFAYIAGVLAESVTKENSTEQVQEENNHDNR